MSRVCVIRQYYYPLDIRVRREVEALLGAGHEVDVVCLRAPGEPRRERHGRLRVHRLPMAHTRGSGATYLRRYAAFLALATVTVALRHVQRRYDLVQVHSLPDPLVFAALVPKLTGTPVLLDLHETMPEFFATKFGRDMTHPLVRSVGRVEQLSIRFADHVLTCTEQMRQAFVGRGADPDAITVVLNSADESIFDRRRYPHRPDGGRFTLVCHGSIEERYGLDTVIRALALLEDLPDVHFDVYGSGSYRGELVRLAQSLGVASRVHFSDGFVPMEDLLTGLSTADVGVVAMKQDVFRDLTHCNKMYEFLAMGIPVLTSRTRSVAAYFGDDAVHYFRPGDPEDLATAVRTLRHDEARRRQLVEGGRRALEPYRWERQREIYRAAVRRLLDPGERRPGDQVA